MLIRKICLVLVFLIIGSDLCASPSEDFAYMKGQQRYKMYKMAKGYSPSESFCKEKAQIIAKLEKQKNPMSKFPQNYFIYGCMGK